jgi:hypothetical protein
MRKAIILCVLEVIMAWVIGGTFLIARHLLGYSDTVSLLSAMICGFLILNRSKFKEDAEKILTTCNQ